MTRPANSSTEIEPNINSSSLENQEQKLLPNIRNIVVMENGNGFVDKEESSIADTSDVFILLSHYSSRQSQKVSDNSGELIEEHIRVKNQDNDFRVNEEEQIFQEIRHAISLLSRRPAPPVKSQTKTSESGATRTTKSHNLHSVNQTNQIIDSEEDEYFQLLTSTFANIFTLMSHRPVPQVQTSPKTSESGASRSRKSGNMVVPASPIDQQGDNWLTDDGDFQLLTSTFANIFTLMSRRPVPPVRTSPKTSEPGASRLRSTHNLATNASTETIEAETKHEDNIDVIKSTLLNLLTMVLSHTYSPYVHQEDTLGSEGVRVYRIQ